ncbi:SAPS-domain-containing protein [Hesseltinella vesiculosa]|uniref:SAPS-domain-containing protein n=1 Tax=Hesseltinella vesiculosa TaxID=101127 RepID=A0A1X2G448_9FUNG|nr:SAPS-domain-containing protein [Hesseltinella vesiculosa]
MLSRFGLGKSTSTLDALLDNRKATLVEMLAVEDCLLQVQLRHKRLIEFMKQPLVISQLIRYLVIDDDQFAPIASEILASSIPALMDTLLSQHQELLTVYWTLLYQDYALTRRQVAYFVKINQVLLTRRPADMVQFLYHLTDLLPHWIQHIHDPSGAPLIELLLSMVECELVPETKGIAKWFLSQGLIELLLQQLQPDKDPMSHQVGEHLLAGVIRLGQTSHHQMKSMGHNELIRGFASEQTMQRLMDIMLDADSPEAIDSFLCGARLIIHFIRYNDERSTHPDITPTHVQILIPMIQCATARISSFIQLLDQPRSKCPHRFGMERLVLLELLAEWLHCADLAGMEQHGLALKTEFYSLRLVPRTLDLFFAFPSCNLAHTVICDMIGQVFENRHLDQILNRNLLLSVFLEGRLLQRLLQVDQQIKELEASGKSSSRPGFMGHLVLLTRAVQILFEQQPPLINILRQNVNGVSWDAWRRYQEAAMQTYQSWAQPLQPHELIEPRKQPPSPATSTPNGFPLPPPPIYLSPSNSLEIRMTVR